MVHRGQPPVRGRDGEQPTTAQDDQGVAARLDDVALVDPRFLVVGDGRRGGRRWRGRDAAAGDHDLVERGLVLRAQCGISIAVGLDLTDDLAQRVLAADRLQALGPDDGRRRQNRPAQDKQPRGSPHHAVRHAVIPLPNRM